MVLDWLNSLFKPFLSSTQQSTTSRASLGGPPSCRQDPRKCLAQLMMDGLVIICAYAMLTHFIEGKTLDAEKTITFYTLFVGLSFSLKWMDVEFGDQLARVVGFQLGTKLFGALAPI